MEDKKKSEPCLNERDFYNQACSYFFYHAGQRTTLINYFIAVFAAAIALYGSLLTQYTVASVCISVFLFIVTFLFYMIDLRNRFDVKESENVIRQIERDHGVDRPTQDNAYGVFSNETNVFSFYGIKNRKQMKKKLRPLRKLYCKVKNGKADAQQLDAAIEQLLRETGDIISKKELYASLSAPAILPLSLCIKGLYLSCMAMSLGAFVLSLIMLFI